MQSSSSKYTLVTGATGFLGHYLLAELLQRGRRCVVSVRQAPERAAARMAELLSPLGINLHREIASRRVVLAEGDLRSALTIQPSIVIDSVVHAAASTRFDPDESGDPRATNVEGTRRLLDWCSTAGVRSFHYISTAFSCGRTTRVVPEQFHDGVHDFHNEYERTKHDAETHCRAWADRVGAVLTIYRPSIIVGEYGSGRATKFDAFYVAVRAAQVLARMLERSRAERRASIAWRIRGCAADLQNIVPVDYVARMVAGAVEDPARHGRIYHLVHPRPPTTAQIKEHIESFFGIAGGRLVPPDEFDLVPMDTRERAFHEASKSVRHYLSETPRFDRCNAEELERSLGLHCPTFDRPAVHRLCRCAVEAEWGRKTPPPRVAGDLDPCAEYFERFLPQRVPASRIARMANLTATVRFVIDGADEGGWVCRFEKGSLALVLRGADDVREDFGYRADLAGFRRAVSGRAHPQELFLSGNAEIFGDVERALKMAMILNAFAREFPFDPEASDAPHCQGDRACAAP